MAQNVEELTWVLLQYFLKENGDTLNDCETIILTKIIQGEKMSDIAKTLLLSRERVRQLWKRMLHKIAHAKNTIEKKDEEIALLKQTIQNIEEKISYDCPKKITRDGRTPMDLLFGPIESCGFTPRTINGLRQANIETIYELIDHPRRDIELIPHLGKKSLNEIDLWLEMHGLDYGMHGVNTSNLKSNNPSFHYS